MLFAYTLTDNQLNCTVNKDNYIADFNNWIDGK